jgi:uncharacterized protein (TIGR03067 family)
MWRVIVSLVALACLTAFAPAPFPSPRRNKHADDVISLETFSGRWRVASMKQCSADGNHRPYVWSVSHVRVKDGVWAFQYNNGGAETTYRLTIDNAKQPAHLDFWAVGGGGGQGQAPPGGGIIRRKGDVVEIIYVFGGNNRPVSFERPPAGQYLLTLQREE